MKLNPIYYLAGLAIGILLFFCFIDFSSYRYPYEGLHNPVLSSGAIILVPVVLILLVANLILTVVYVKKLAPFYAYILAWGPVLLIPLVFNHYNDKAEDYRLAHPNIQEVHINLTGKTIKIDPDIFPDFDGRKSTLKGKEPENFISFVRYHGDAKDPMPDYDGTYLAETFKSMKVRYGTVEKSTTVMLPVIHPATYPDVSKFIGKIDYKPTVAALLEYRYYYYSDRVEIATALQWSSLVEDAMTKSHINHTKFALASLQSIPIVRLEIEGQEISLHRGIPTEKYNPCCDRYTVDAIVNQTDAPMKIRWQLAEINPKWHESQVQKPISLTLPFKGGEYAHAAELYFSKDGSVFAEFK